MNVSPDVYVPHFLDASFVSGCVTLTRWYFDRWQEIFFINTVFSLSKSGICPQHNVLYDNLTVEEHLWFFANLKGISDSALVKSEVNRFIVTTGLEDKRNVMTKMLSGGMKRKLSVGIALIGDSKVCSFAFISNIF